MSYPPLENHLVLEKVFDNLPLSDLKSCRLVSTFWNDISVSRIISVAGLCFEGSRLEQFLTLLSTFPNNKSSLTDCITSSTALIPFDTCTIKIGSILSSNCKLNLLWFHLPSSIKYLTLHITTVYAHKELKCVLLNYFPNLQKIKVIVMKYWGTAPATFVNDKVIEEDDDDFILPNGNLQHFQLCYLGFDEADDGNTFRFPMQWAEFFTRFPNINYLSMIGLNSEDISGMIVTLDEIQARGDRRLPIKSLEILDESIFPESPADDHFRGIARLTKYAFESFHFEISPFTTGTELKLAISKYGNTLKSLRLRRYPLPIVTASINFSDLNLKFVTFLEVSNGLLSSLSCLSSFPSLQIFHVILRDYRSLPYCELLQNTTSSFSHENVKSVYIEPPLISEDCIVKMATCFPNLEALRLRANNEILGEICLQAQTNSSSAIWQDLRDLYITSWNGLTDEGITGISEEILKTWANYSCFEPEKQRTLPYIGLIKGLSSLTIEMWTDYNNHICDWSVHYGISDLKQLQEITLIRTGVSQTAFRGIPMVNKRLVE